MSQSAIDALMAQHANDGDEVEDEEQIEALTPPPSEISAERPRGPVPDDLFDGVLTDEERALVEAAAAEAEAEIGSAGQPQAATPGGTEQAALSPEAEVEEGPKLRRWSASSAAETDQLKERVDEIEAKIDALDDMTSSSTSDAALVEIKQTLEQLTGAVQSLWNSLHQLTEHAQGSLGFAAKQTFDCPECGSHGTVSVPVSCTSCGFESEWGFYPEQS